MSADFVNRTSRVAISARVADWQRQSRICEDWLPGDYHPPFGREEARAEAAKWIWQPWIIAVEKHRSLDRARWFSVRPRNLLGWI